MEVVEPSGEIHEAQMRIISTLAQSNSARFRDLTKATLLTSDHTNFHIKKLITNGLVERIPKAYGEYRLTRAGKNYSTRMNTQDSTLERPPKLSVVLSVTNSEGKVLRQQRLKQPYYGFWSRPTGKIRRGETIVQAAERKLVEETGLTATWKISGVEHRIDKSADGILYDDKYLFTLDGVNPKGELAAEKAGMRNYWMDEEEYSKKPKRFGKPLKSELSQEGAATILSEGIFTFNEEDF